MTSRQSPENIAIALAISFRCEEDDLIEGVSARFTRRDYLPGDRNRAVEIRADTDFVSISSTATGGKPTAWTITFRRKRHGAIASAVVWSAIVIGDTPSGVELLELAEANAMAEIDGLIYRALSAGLYRMRENEADEWVCAPTASTVAALAERMRTQWHTPRLRRIGGQTLPGKDRK